MAVRKLCPRCRKIMDNQKGLCKECEARRQREYDKVSRNKDSASFYKSPAWLRVRARVLAKSCGIDYLAYALDGVLKRPTTVHHIVELTEDKGKGLSEDNLIALSDSSHARVHAEYAKGASDKRRMQTLLRSLKEKYGC